MPPLDALVGPAAMVALWALLPQLTGRLVRAVLGVRGDTAPPERGADLRLAYGLLDASQMVVAFRMGRHALGPELVPIPEGPASLAFGLLLALVAWRSLRATRPSPWPDRAASRGPVGGGVLLGIALGAGLFGGHAAIELETALSEAEVETVPAERARFRLLLDPWDPLATLGLAWACVGSEEIERARELLEAAAIRGAPSEQRLRLRTALEATAGNCPAAHAAFETWLTEHAAHAFAGERILHERLSLESFQPPAAYLSRCGTAPAPDEAVGDEVRTSPDASR